jgi:hypothetical protein
MSAPREKTVITDVRWEIPRTVWAILLGWGISILVLAALFSLWIWNSQQEQNRAMCLLLDTFTAGPPPPAGPAGDEAREGLAAIRAYQDALKCDDLRSPPPR